MPGRAALVVTDARRIRVQKEGKAGQRSEPDLQLRLPGLSHHGRYEAGSSVTSNVTASIIGTRIPQRRPAATVPG